MARSPTAQGEPGQADYLRGWAATHRMMREGMSWSGREKNCSFLNLQGGGFADVSAVSGLGFLDDARAAGVVDWDQDGRLDLWLTNRTAPQVRVLLNRAPSTNDWVAFRLQGTQGSRTAIGARVELQANGRRLVRSLRAGEGYLAQSSTWIHFGLGDAPSLDELIVRWPGGARERFTGATSGARWLLIEGSGEALPEPAPAREVDLDPSKPEVPAASERARVALFTRLPLPAVDYESPDGAPASSKDFAGRPLLVNLWASWCAPCVGELRDFQEHASELKDAGLEVLALSMEIDEGRADSREMLERLGWTFPSGYIGPDALDVLDLFQKSLVDRKRRMPVPTSFLIDGDGWLAAVYKGPIEVETLLADVAALDLEPRGARDYAAPRGGRWRGPPPMAFQGLIEMVDSLRTSGQLAAAAAYHENLLLRPEVLKNPGMQSLRQMVVQQGLSLGIELQEQELLTEAVEVFARLVEIDGKASQARSQLAGALERLGRVEEALVHHAALVEARPKHLPYRLRLASALLNGGDPQGAARELRIALKIRPDFFRAHLELGRALREMGQLGESRASFQRALDLRPDDADARRELAATSGG